MDLLTYRDERYVPCDDGLLFISSNNWFVMSPIISQEESLSSKERTITCTQPR